MPSVSLPASHSETLAAGERLTSLDVARGVTIVGMIVVNNPGSWDVVYSVLRHAQWHGFAFVDLGFPAFVFLLGMSVAIAFSRRMSAGETRGRMLARAWRRALVLCAMGLVLEAFPFVALDAPLRLHEHVVDLRIPGVLQRLSVCYLLAAHLFVLARPRVQYVTAAAILLGYWAALAWIPVPGFGAGHLDPPEATLPAYVDRLVFGRHLFAGGAWDPEGLLGTFPAVVTALLGVWTGRYLLLRRPQAETLARLGAAGLGLVVLGYAWHQVLPVNKQLWTSSFVALTGGLALCCYAVIYWAVEVKQSRVLRRGFTVFGANALTVYVLSALADEALEVIRIATPEGATVLRAYLFEQLFLPLAPPVVASLLYAVVWVAAWLGILLLVERRRPYAHA